MEQAGIQNYYCNFMFEGQRLSYVVPGYTGHIPTKVYDEFQPLGQPEPTGKIPGYAGYVHGIKPENLYGSTFGKTTLNVDNQSFVKGQDYEARDKYVSTNTASYIPPSERFQRTAADIVGVPPCTIKVKAPANPNLTGKEVDQFTQSRSQNFYETVKGKDTKWSESNVKNKDGKQYVEIGQPLPGYTGFGKRVLANNIFGKTYAECLKEAKRDDDHLHHEKQRNFNNQLNSDVPLKF